jgi:hypothetical protein
VSPERIEDGIDITRSISSLGAVSEAERSEVIRRAMRKGVLRRLWETLKNFWDNLNSNWNYWVISYDSNQQRSVMDDLGMGEAGWVTLAVILVFAIGITVALISAPIRSFAPTGTYAERPRGREWIAGHGKDLLIIRPGCRSDSRRSRLRSARCWPCSSI